MITIDDYQDSDAAPMALVADLTDRLAAADAAPVYRDDAAGIAVLRDNTVIDWSRRLPRPARRSGSVDLATPESFANYVTRLAVPETVVYADKAAGRLVAVFNDHPQVSGDSAGAVGTIAGWRDHRAAMNLTTHPDWAEWMQWDGKLRGQRAFGEFIDSMAHTVMEPDAATMLEVATTLTAKQTIDYDSRTRLENGDTSFTFVQETAMQAGRRNQRVEIPGTFVFEAPVWYGTMPVRVTARLRIMPERDGVMLGYKLIRLADATEEAFAGVIADVRAGIGDELPIFMGQPG